MTSRSFMDAIKSVGRKSADLTEGAKDKTSDGMTKDAKHFAQDLHKVQDSGMKHLVQKDSETKDYEKMFKGDVDKFPTRPADMEPSQSLDKYVEYNEAVHMEAKKLSKKDDQKTGDNPDNEDATGPLTNEAKKCGKDCKCDDCKKIVSEIVVDPRNTNTPAGKALAKSLSGPNASTLPNQAGQGPASPMRQQGTSGAGAKPPVRAPQAAPAPARSITPGRGGSAGGRYGMQRPEISKPSGSTKQPYGMNIPKKSPTLQAQTDGKTGGKHGIAPDKKPLAKPADQPYNMNIPKKSPTLQAQTDGNITDKKPAGQQPGPINTSKGPSGRGEVVPNNTSKGPSGRGEVVPNNTAKAVPPKPTLKPTDGSSKPSAPQKFTSKHGLNAPELPSGAKPKKPGAAQQIKPDRQAGTPRGGGTKNNDVGPRAKPQGGVVTGKVTGTTATSKPRVAGVNNLRQSYEIEWNGNSYVMNEAAIEALGTFIEKYGQVNEVVDMTDTRAVVHDFAHSKNEKFAGKSPTERIRMALGASYAAKRRK